LIRSRSRYSLPARSSLCGCLGSLGCNPRRIGMPRGEASPRAGNSPRRVVEHPIPRARLSAVSNGVISYEIRRNVSRNFDRRVCPLYELLAPREYSNRLFIAFLSHAIALSLFTLIASPAIETARTEMTTKWRNVRICSGREILSGGCESDVRVHAGVKFLRLRQCARNQ